MDGEKRARAEIQATYDRLRDFNIPLLAASEAAGLSHSTVLRWVKGRNEPLLSKWREFEAATERLIAARMQSNLSNLRGLK